MKYFKIAFLALIIISIGHSAFAASKITVGSRGPEVAQLSQQLTELGYLTNSNKPEVFGPAVFSAVKQFQKDNNLKADGVVGPTTLGIILKKVSEVQSHDGTFQTNNQKGSCLNKGAKLEISNSTFSIKDKSVSFSIKGCTFDIKDIVAASITAKGATSSRGIPNYYVKDTWFLNQMLTYNLKNNITLETPLEYATLTTKDGVTTVTLPLSKAQKDEICASKFISQTENFVFSINFGKQATTAAPDGAQYHYEGAPTKVLGLSKCEQYNKPIPENNSSYVWYRYSK